MHPTTVAYNIIYIVSPIFSRNEAPVAGSSDAAAVIYSLSQYYIRYIPFTSYLNTLYCIRAGTSYLLCVYTYMVLYNYCTIAATLMCLFGKGWEIIYLPSPTRPILFGVTEIGIYILDVGYVPTYYIH